MRKLKPTHESEFDYIVQLIEEARNRAFSKVNTELVLLYFNIGNIVSIKVADGVWGQGTVDDLANYIKNKTPGLSGFNRRGLYRMKQFYETYFPGSDCFKSWVDVQQTSIVSPTATQIDTQRKTDDFTNDLIVSPMATQLQNPENLHSGFVKSLLCQVTWTNHLEIISGAKSSEEKLFYLLITAKEKPSKLELRRQIKTATFERTMLANKNLSALPPLISSGIFKDPYIFEFLDIPDTHSENDLEKAIIKNLQKFIIEIGKGFAYMGSQFRLQVGNKDYHTDLLFYHRDLQCLVLFELKVEEFEPEFLGKLDFYLEALDRDVKRPHENPSIGVLLCKGKDNEVVEYAMARSTSPAMIADYETKLISKKILADKLHQLTDQLSIEKT
jgi:predicted nuclease of restriction endonuclease-like (RecB) superfamily